MKKLIIALALMASATSAMAAGNEYFACGSMQFTLNGSTAKLNISRSSYRQFNIAVADGSIESNKYVADLMAMDGSHGIINRNGKYMTVTDAEGVTTECYLQATDSSIAAARTQAKKEQAARDAQAEKERAAKAEQDRKAEAEFDKVLARNKALHDQVMTQFKGVTLTPAGGSDWQHGGNGVAISYVCDLMITDAFSRNEAGPIMYEKGGVIIKDFGPDAIEISYKPLQGIHKTVRASLRGGAYTFAFKNGTMNFVDAANVRQNPNQAYELYNCATTW